MAQSNSPSSVMYAHFKKLGVSYRDTATVLMRTELSFAGRPLKTRIEESSQLSRRIVHVAPGEIPSTLFDDLAKSCTALRELLVSRSWHTSLQQTTDLIIEHLGGEAAADMAAALSACGLDDALFENALHYIRNLELEDEYDRLLLLLFLFVGVGTHDSSQFAVDYVSAYASETLHATFSTEETQGCEAQLHEPRTAGALALARVIDGQISAKPFHQLNPSGTEIGLLSTDSHAICDVEDDVSRKHALIWREEGRWLIKGLGSTNGTTLTRGHDHSKIVVEAPKAQRGNAAAKPVELAPTDIIRFGNSTEYMVLLAASE